MEYGGVSTSDIDFEFDTTSSGSDSDDISIATDASSVAISEPRNGISGLTDQVDRSMRLSDIGYEGELILNDSRSGRNVDAFLKEKNSPRNSPRCRLSSADSDDFGPPVVVPLKTGSDHSDGEPDDPIPKGSRSSRSSRRSARSGSFSRRPPVRTKSGGEMANSTHSAASGRRRPPGRTKSGGVIAEEDGEVRRRPPRRSKSGDRGDGIVRRPPHRTKSGGTLKNGDGNDAHDYSSDHYISSDEEAVCPTNSPNYRKIALERNAARRQKSSDMLGAMRDATRNIPGRSQSGIANGRRRNIPTRSKSSDPDVDVMATPGRKPLRRKAPPRTKSGGTLKAPPLEL